MYHTKYNTSYTLKHNTYIVQYLIAQYLMHNTKMLHNVLSF